MYSLLVPKENKHDKDLEMEQEVWRLMDQYGNDVLRTSFMYLKDMQRAEDAFQEVFIKVFNKYITINVCKDMLRSSWLKRVVLTDQIAKRWFGCGGQI